MNTQDLVNMLVAEKAKGIQHVTFENEKRVDTNAFVRAFYSLAFQDEYRKFFVEVAIKTRRDIPLTYVEGRGKWGQDVYNGMYNGTGYRSYLEDWINIRGCIENSLYCTKEGKFMIRLNKAFHKVHGVKLPEKFIGVMGSNLNNHIEKPSSYTFDFTNVFDWEDGEFGHDGSCWFPGGGYSDSLPTFQNGGGWAIRFYGHGVENSDSKENKYNRGIARTWIYPNYDSLTCFNTYGNEIKDVFAVLKHVMKQYTQDEVKLTTRIYIGNNRSSSIPYVNGGSGFTVSDCKEWNQSDSAYFNMEVVECEDDDDNHCTCEHCSRRVHIDDSTYVNDTVLCDSCFDDECDTCYHCGDADFTDNMTEMDDTHHVYCQHCLDRHVDYITCDSCSEYFENDDYVITEDTGCTYCSDCAEDRVIRCEECSEPVENHEAVDGENYCESCAIDKRKELEEENNIETT